jgi:hypothetical protein
VEGHGLEARREPLVDHGLDIVHDLRELLLVQGKVLELIPLGRLAPTCPQDTALELSGYGEEMQGASLPHRSGHSAPE